MCFVLCFCWGDVLLNESGQRQSEIDQRVFPVFQCLCKNRRCFVQFVPWSLPICFVLLICFGTYTSCCDPLLASGFNAVSCTSMHLAKGFQSINQKKHLCLEAPIGTANYGC